MYALMLVSAAVTAIFLQPVVADIKRLSKVSWTVFKGQDTTRPIVAEVAGRFEHQFIFALIYFHSKLDDICFEYEKPGYKNLFCDYPAKVYFANNMSQPKDGHYTDNCFNRSSLSAWNPKHRDIMVSYDGGDSLLIFPKMIRIRHSDFAELDQFMNGIVPTRDIMRLWYETWTMYTGGKNRPVVVKLFGLDDFQYRSCNIYLQNNTDNVVKEEDIGSKKICKYPAEVYPGSENLPKEGYFPGDCSIKDDPTSWYPKGQTLHVVYEDGKKAMRFHNIDDLQRIDFASLDQSMNGVVPIRDIMIMYDYWGWRMYIGEKKRPVVVKLFGLDDFYDQYRHCYIYLENHQLIKEEVIDGREICKYPAKVYLDARKNKTKDGYFPGDCTIKDNPTSWYPQRQTLSVVYEDGKKAMLFPNIDDLQRINFAPLDQSMNGVVPTHNIMILSFLTWIMYKGNTTRPIVVEVYGEDDIDNETRYCYITLETKLDNEVKEEVIGGRQICKYPAKLYLDDNLNSKRPPNEGYFPGNCNIKDDPTSWNPLESPVYVVYDDGMKAIRFDDKRGFLRLEHADFTRLDQKLARRNPK